MKRDAFEFDGGMVRLTLAGAFIMKVAQFLLWLIIGGLVLAVLILLGFEFAAQAVGFTPLWRL